MGRHHIYSTDTLNAGVISVLGEVKQNALRCLLAAQDMDILLFLKIFHLIFLDYCYLKITETVASNKKIQKEGALTNSALCEVNFIFPLKTKQYGTVQLFQHHVLKTFSLVTNLSQRRKRIKRLTTVTCFKAACQQEHRYQWSTWSVSK